MNLRPSAWITLLGVAVAVSPPPPAAAASDLDLRGLFETVAAQRGHAYDTNLLTRGDSPLDAASVRLFVDGRVNDRLTVFSQFVMRDASDPYVDGAYLSYTPFPERDLHVLAGKLPWAIGTWGPRTYSNRNPLIGIPLMYQYHSSLLWYEVVPSADVLLAAAATGQYGVNYFGYAEGRGMPIVDDCYWDVGLTVTGSRRPLEYALGVTAGTPGWGSTMQDENSGKTVLGRLGVAPLPGVRFGVSGAYGPYLVAGLQPLMPSGRSVNDYRQKLVMADLELLVDRVELRAEGARNTWETPTVGDLEVKSAYAELKYAFGFGAFLAGRWDVLRFGEIAASGGGRYRWDSDVSRIEAGVGYRFTPEVVGKVVHQRTRLENEYAPAKNHRLGLYAAQVSVSF